MPERRATVARDPAEPALKDGPLLDVLMEPTADWTFLDEATSQGFTEDHCVGLLLFPREKIEGRQPEFAAEPEILWTGSLSALRRYRAGARHTTGHGAAAAAR